MVDVFHTLFGVAGKLCFWVWAIAFFRVIVVCFVLRLLMGFFSQHRAVHFRPSGFSRSGSCVLYACSDYREERSSKGLEGIGEA